MREKLNGCIVELKNVAIFVKCIKINKPNLTIFQYSQ